MSTTAVTIDGAALQRFLEAVHDLSERPTAPNVARYLRASNELDGPPPKPRAIRSSRPRNEIGAKSAA